MLTRPLPGAAADQTAAILYTSGTTALPKGVVHTHRTSLAAALAITFDASDVAAVVTPMAHAAGYWMLPLASTPAPRP